MTWEGEREGVRRGRAGMRVRTDGGRVRDEGKSEGGKNVL